MDALYRIARVGTIPLQAGTLVAIHNGRAYPVGALLSHRDRRGRTWFKPATQPRGILTYVGQHFAQVCVRGESAVEIAT